MLCSACSNIDFSPPYQRNIKHHASFDDALDAAENGCELCMLRVREGRRTSFLHTYTGHGAHGFASLQIFYRLCPRVGEQDSASCRDGPPNLTTIHFQQVTNTPLESAFERHFERKEKALLQTHFDLFTMMVSLQFRDLSISILICCRIFSCQKSAH